MISFFTERIYVYSVLRGALSAFVPLVPVLALIQFFYTRKNKLEGIKTKKRHIAGVYLFCFMLFCVLDVTGIPNAYNFVFNFNYSYSPIFSTNYYWAHHVLNTILFLPIGFMLPLLWKPYNKFYFTFLYGCLFSLFIEVAQMFNYRTTDISDWILNTVGTILGYLIFILVKKIAPSIAKFTIGKENHLRSGHMCATFLVILFVAFIQPIVKDFYWGYVVG